MIFAADKGRMCNNILQFGHCYAWAREHGYNAVSMRFCYKYPGFKIRHTRRHNFFTYLWAKYGSAAGIVPVVRFDDPDEDSASIEAKLARIEHAARRWPGVVMSGWEVRHYDLFLKYRDEIVGLFSLDNPNSSAVKRLPGEILLGLHIRRGDYDRWNGGRYFYTDEQYADVVRRFKAALPDADTKVRVIVATNDFSLDIDRFRQLCGDAVTGVEPPASSAVGDLEALSQCDYIMGPPSTFSLVAAMYRDLPLKFITGPGEEFSLSDFSDFAHLFRYEY